MELTFKLHSNLFPLWNKNKTNYKTELYEMRNRRKHTSAKLGLIFIITLFLLASTSVSYSLWYDELHLDITIETGQWEASIKIKKTLDYVPGENDIFQLTITVWNDGPSNLTDAEVTDILGVDATPIPGSEILSHGYVNWINTPVSNGEINELTWYIGDLLIDEIATLSVDITADIICSGGETSSVVVYPADGSTISVPRYDHASGITGLGYYFIEHLYGSRLVRLENLVPNLGEDGMIQTDTFVLTVMSGSVTVDVTVTTKAGSTPPEGVTTTLNLGDTYTDSLGFTLSFIDVTDIGGGMKEYSFDITSDDESVTKALSHIDFDFGFYSEDCDTKINTGATVTADAGIICGILEATTESITITIDTDGFIDPPLPYSTPWAGDYCNYCEDCE